MSKKVDLRQAKKEAEQPPVEDIRTTERYEVTPKEVNFSISYDSPAGETINATLTSRVLDGDGRMAKTRVYNRLMAGLDQTRLPRDEELRIEALSRVAAQLTDLPDWLSEAVAMDNELLGYINMTLVEHEKRYFRGYAEKGESGEVKARVRVSSPFSEG